MKRALVLGSGGYAASSWELGVMAGLADGGVNVREADSFVGTSAGARVAVLAASGRATDELLQRALAPLAHPGISSTPVDVARWRASFDRTMAGPGDPAQILRRLGRLGAELPASSGEATRAQVADEVATSTWPDRHVAVVAVDADTGARRAFDRSSGAPLLEALAASGALPGMWPSVTIDGHRYMDGGVYSIANADVAAGADRVLVLTLRERVPPLFVVPLAATLDVLQKHGARVHVVEPDDTAGAALAAVHGNVLDPAVRAGMARAGREQGRRVANSIRAFWCAPLNDLSSSDEDQPAVSTS